MLQRLAVSGLGIIDSVEVELASGFVALTGETGAGKSLLVTSLELLAGRRASSELVRTGETKLRVEGWFSSAVGSPLVEILAELGAENDGPLVIRRELSAAGRGRCWVNDVSVRAATLQRIAPHLLSIHGQHEQHGLSDPEVQRRLVDAAGGHNEHLEIVADRYGEWRQLAEAHRELVAARAGRRDRLDAIAFQLAEIEAVAPLENEHDELTARRLVLRNATRLRELAGSLLGRLGDDEGSVVDHLAEAERQVEEMIGSGLELDDAATGLTEARIHIEELLREVRTQTAGIDGDPGQLDAVESRLHALDQLMLKYGEPLAQVLEHRRALIDERVHLEEVEDRLEASAEDLAAALDRYAGAAEALDKVRRSAGDELARAMQEILGRLNMGGTELEFRWQPRSDEASPLLRDGAGVFFDATGVEQCELLIAANPGEEPRPMSRIASGGELSRIHLAIRTVLRRMRPEGAMTLLFDEVDSGLGGATAAALGSLLADLAGSDQVVAVTHLPQVAAGAGDHLRIDKVNEGGRSVTRVRRLEGEERELELARMLAGDELGPSARAHARSLLGES